jgi:hypothetical protein
MSIPPVIVSIRVRERGHRGFRIWLPMFLLWPFVFVLWVLALVVAIVVDTVLFVSGQRYHHYSKLLVWFFETSCDLRGLKVYVDGVDSTVAVTVS